MLVVTGIFKVKDIFTLTYESINLRFVEPFESVTKDDILYATLSVLNMQENQGNCWAVELVSQTKLPKETTLINPTFCLIGKFMSKINENTINMKVFTHARSNDQYYDFKIDATVETTAINAVPVSPDNWVTCVGSIISAEPNMFIVSDYNSYRSKCE